MEKVNFFSGKWPVRLIFIAAILSYILSLTQLGFSVGENNGWPGYGILLFGILGLPSGSLANFVWCANPLLFLAWLFLLLKEGRNAAILSTLSIFIACLFLFCKEVLISDSGDPSSISRVGMGYWLWLASMVLTLLGSIMNQLKAKEQKSS